MRARESSTLAFALAVVLVATALAGATTAAGAPRTLPRAALALTITFAGDDLGRASDAMSQPSVSGVATVGNETGRYHGTLVPGATYLPLGRCYYCFAASGSLTITTPSGTLTAVVDPTRSTMSLSGGANKSAGYLLVLELGSSEYAGKTYRGTLKGYYARNPAYLVFNDATQRLENETAPDSGQVGGPVPDGLRRALERLDQLLQVGLARDSRFAPR